MIQTMRRPSRRRDKPAREVIISALSSCGETDFGRWDRARCGLPQGNVGAAGAVHRLQLTIAGLGIKVISF
jgi:hypothetical protein